MSCSASPDFRLEVGYLLGRREVHLEATCLAKEAPASIWVELREPDGRTTLRRSEVRLADGQRSATAAWPAADLRPGRYWALIWDAGGREILKSAFLDLPAAPEWVGNEAGAYTDRWVPRPWTPLELPSSALPAVRCWGREYTFGPSGLAAVESQGEAVLASPLVWTARIAGRAVEWTPGATKVLRREPGVVEIESSQSAPELGLTCRGRIEFDGFVKLGFRLEGGTAGLTLDALTLDVPLRSAWAELMHYFPKVPVWYGGVGVQGLNAGSVPAAGWSSAFIPHVWVGDEERGLQWLCESDRGWRPADPQRAIELVRQGDAQVLRLNLIGQPTPLASPRSYTFGFMASPVKLLPPERYQWHYTHVGGCSDILRDADRMRELGVRLVDTLTWTELWGYPRAATRENVELLHSTVRASRARGMGMMVYFAFLMSAAAPEYGALNRECRIVDPHAYQCPGWMNDTVYAVCQKSVWSEFMLSSIDESLREFDLDGIYSDSMTCIGECSNLLHGCGYTGEDGTVHPTVEVFAVREFMKRVYRLLELRERQTGRPMRFIGHTSANVMLPTLSFCTAYLDTEHLTGMSRPFAIPLDAFRAEFMGRNFGVPAQALSYHHRNGGKGLTSGELLAVSLLHDVETPWSYETMAPVWKAWDEFGMTDTEFLPYWQEWGWRAPEGVKVSAYAKPGRREMLAVATNVATSGVSGELCLGGAVTRAADAIGARSISLREGQVVDTFPPGQARMYRLSLAP